MAKLVKKAPSKKTPAQKLGRPVVPAKPSGKTPKEMLGGKRGKGC